MDASTHFEVIIEPGNCWGRFLCEDSGEGACDLCVQICPEVFEKPQRDACARVKPGADLLAHLEAIEEAAWQCPVNAVRVKQVNDYLA